MISVNEMRRLFEQIEKQKLKVTHPMCGKCFKDLGTNKDCLICSNILEWVKGEDAKRETKN